MDLMSLFLCLLIVFYCSVSILKSSKISRKLPPGPRPLPLIGNLLELGDMPHESLANLAKTYGPIMTLKLGQKTEYVISSPTLAKEIFQKQDLIFSTRSMPNALYTHDHFKYSVAWMPVSDRWKNLRKILKTVIFQTNKLNASQNLRREKMYALIAYVRKCCDEGVEIDIGRAASTTLLNMLSNTLFSMDLGEGLLEELNEVISNIMINTGKKNLADFFPVLGFIDPQGLRRQMTNSFKKMFKIVRKLVDERIKSRTLKKNGDMNHDLLDNLLDMGEDISRTQVEYLLTDLFIAGTDTTSTTVEWAMAEILRNSKILEKLKAELEVTVGRGRHIEESDIAHLPYLRAVVEETLRKHPPGPLISRTVEVDAEISKYVIPKGARVQVNVWAMARDPDLWESPNMFEPNRFMGSDIDIRAHNFEHNPFGVGRRSCLGVPLATRIVPVMIGSLINSFDWKLENGIALEELSMEEKYGFTLRKAQPLRIVPITF